MTATEIAQAYRDVEDAKKFFASVTRLSNGEISLFGCNHPIVVKYRTAIRIIARAERRTLRQRCDWGSF